MFFSSNNNIHAFTYTNNIVDSSTALRIESILKEMNALMAQKSEENRAKNLVGESSGEKFVPFYSQVLDISDYKWKGVSCGIVGLAMIIDYYQPSVDINTLLQQGIETGAYNDTNGWSHAGLINVAQKNGLNGQAVYAVSFDTLVQAVEEGPVIVSVDYSMTAQNTIPHLIVVTDIKDGVVQYNNPASLSGGETILADNFKMTWKKNYIEIKPERNFAYKMLK